MSSEESKSKNLILKRYIEAGKKALAKQTDAVLLEDSESEEEEDDQEAPPSPPKLRREKAVNPPRPATPPPIPEDEKPMTKKELAQYMAELKMEVQKGNGAKQQIQKQEMAKVARRIIQVDD